MRRWRSSMTPRRTSSRLRVMKTVTVTALMRRWMRRQFRGGEI